MIEGVGELARLENAPREVAKWQKAQQHLLGGRYSHALSAYRELTRAFPNISQLWFEFGIAAGGDLDFAFAHQAFQSAVNLAGQDDSMLVLIGQQYQQLRQLDRARECFERAVTAKPDSAHARLTLAAWFERERRLDDAWNATEECLRREPKNPQALYFKSFLLHRKCQHAEAETALRDLLKTASLEPAVKQSATHLLGVVLDELGQYAEAMRWLAEAKTLLRQISDAAGLERIYERTDRQRRELLAELTPTTIRRWRDESPGRAEPWQLAFLGGHPRSGTTLVEQILGAHPELKAFDESDAFTQEIVNQVAPVQSMRGLTLDGLNGMSAAVRAGYRQRYFKSLLREGDVEPTARVLLDKNPSPTASLPLWLRVFPELKVIIPLRDPRDVVISCYFQNLALTSANVNFLSLEGAARHFGGLMDVWLRMRELGGFDWIETRYEDVVANLESEGKRVTEFLGLQWNAGQAAYFETARRKFVFAPTYHDVTKPVHNRAIGRWHHYEEALGPVMERLAPYCRSFGYAQ